MDFRLASYQSQPDQHVVQCALWQCPAPCGMSLCDFCRPHVLWVPLYHPTKVPGGGNVITTSSIHRQWRAAHPTCDLRAEFPYLRHLDKASGPE